VEWHALILIEIVSLLESRLRHYPVDIVDAPEQGLVRVAARIDPSRDLWRARLGRGDAASQLQREMLGEGSTEGWTLTVSDALTLGPSAPRLSLMDVVDEGGQRLYVFRFDGNLPTETEVLLRPLPDRGTETSIRRRLRHIDAARGNLDLLRALGNPRSVGLDPALRAMAPPGVPPEDLDPSKLDAWTAITHGHAIDLVVGPPGVGKTFLVSRLVGSILSLTPAARVLITAQNHDALAEMERTLRDHIETIEPDTIIVRVERATEDLADTQLRAQTQSLLDTFMKGKASPLLRSQRDTVGHVLRNSGSRHEIDPAGEAVLRDTDHLVLRAADVTLATANSAILEELVAEGQQFDWVIVEEAARASGPELIGPLLLGNRRVLIGDHRQLAPFDAERRARLYVGEAAEVLLADASESISAMPDLPDSVGVSLAELKANPALLRDAISAALRLEQPFREIAEQSEEMRGGAHPEPVSTLTEQSRMHPTICQLVSDTFYGGRLTTVTRVLNRACPVGTNAETHAAPVIVLDLPPLSRSRIDSFEKFVGTSPTNHSEVAAVLAALERLRAEDGHDPTLVFLSPYTAQCNLLRARLDRHIDRRTNRLHGFSSPKGDGAFVHTVDSFQGGEADLVIVSTVRNNQKVGRHALGILGDRRRMNVLLSRARHKLVLVTSTGFLRNAIRWTGSPDGPESDLVFLETLLHHITRLAEPSRTGSPPHVAIIPCDENGRVIS
jgi:hypothetical protein